MMYKLNSKSKAYIEEAIGISVESISEMDSEDLDTQIEKKINKKLEHKPSKLFRSSGRGTPFLHLWRFLGIKFIDEKLSKIAK